MPHTAVSDSRLTLTIPVDGVLTNLTVPGKICSTIKSTRNAGKSLQTFCPDCQGPIGNQRVCKNDDKHGPFQQNEVLSGQMVGDKLVIVDKEEADEARTSDIARGKLDLTIVSRESLVDGTIPSGNSYHFVPLPGDEADSENYALIRSAIADNPDWAFVCRANIGRGAETILSVEAGAFGGLTLKNLAYPETLYDLPEYEVGKMSKAEKSAIRTMLEELVGEFDPDEWTDRTAEAIQSAITIASGRRGKKVVAKKKATQRVSVLAAVVANAKEKQAV